VILACNDFASQEILRSVLTHNRFEALHASYLGEAKLLLSQTAPAMVICQANFSDGDFRDLLKYAAEIRSRTPIIVCADHYDPRQYIDAIQLGAFDYFAYPCQPEAIEWAVTGALKEALNDDGVTYGAQRVHA
jgi:DNA-binding NtrC family response regulator